MYPIIVSITPCKLYSAFKMKSLNILFEIINVASYMNEMALKLS